MFCKNGGIKDTWKGERAFKGKKLTLSYFVDEFFYKRNIQNFILSFFFLSLKGKKLIEICIN